MPPGRFDGLRWILRVRGVLAPRNSAHPSGLRSQNCNQWVVEVLAAAWSDLAGGDELRRRAQAWLRDAHYAPEPVDVGSHALMFTSVFVPVLQLDDYPDDDWSKKRLRVSSPSTVEAFAREHSPRSERVELCHDGHQVVVHRGWAPIADGCRPGEGDRVISLDLSTPVADG